MVSFQPQSGAGRHQLGFGGLLGATSILALSAAFAAPAFALHEPAHGGSENMELVGHVDTDGRSIYKGHVHEYPDGRYILMVGYHAGSAINHLTGEEELNGNSFIDVSDPANPQYLYHLPSDAEWDGEGSGGRNLQSCSGEDLPGGQDETVYLQREVSNSQQELWDVTDPENPELLHVISSDHTNTHKNWWECSTGIAYLTNGLEDWHARVTSIWDLSDPENFNPDEHFIRHYSLPEAQPEGAGEGPRRPMTAIHEPLYLDGRVYMAYGTREHGILQILDNDELIDGEWRNREGAADNPTTEELEAPIIGQLNFPIYWGVHTAVPILEVDMPQFQPWAEVTGPRGEEGIEPLGTPRDFVITVSEETGPGGCDDRMDHGVHFVDITDPEFPIPVAWYHVHYEGPEDVNFCERGGRFGAHAMQWNLDDPHYYPDIAFFSWFNAGVRMVDVRDPYNPQELGWFIPDATESTAWGDDELSVAVTNNVEVDNRGYVYLFDRAGTGVHVVEPTGEAREIAGLEERDEPAEVDEPDEADEQQD